MNLKIKITDEKAVVPKYAKHGDAGLDLTITKIQQLDNEHIKYHFGLALEIPFGYVGYIFPRSSCYKQRQIMSNCVGVIDSGYRGEVSAVFIGTNSDYGYKVGDRCAQLVINEIPKVTIEVVKELSKTERGQDGYGSTNN
jgi:dUTP pyrophosphatase